MGGSWVPSRSDLERFFFRDDEDCALVEAVAFGREQVAVADVSALAGYMTRDNLGSKRTIRLLVARSGPCCRSREEGLVSETMPSAALRLPHIAATSSMF